MAKQGQVWKQAKIISSQQNKIYQQAIKVC